MNVKWCVTLGAPRGAQLGRQCFVTCGIDKYTLLSMHAGTDGKQGIKFAWPINKNRDKNNIDCSTREYQLIRVFY